MVVGWEQVSLFLGNGDGTFEPAVKVSAGHGPVFTADFNGDRHADLVFGDGWLLLGNGNGTFISRHLEMVVEAVGDFDGDGTPDLFRRTSWLDNKIGAWLNDGHANFKSAATLVDTNLNNPGSTLVADLNGDRFLDLLRLGLGNPSSVQFANGDGTFRPGPIGQVGHSGLSAAATGYFNPGRKTDLAIIDFEYPSPFVGSFLGQGDGTFSWIERHTIPSSYVANLSTIVVADLNLDGRSDLLDPAHLRVRALSREWGWHVSTGRYVWKGCSAGCRRGF